jgi:hypothetical protein
VNGSLTIYLGDQYVVTRLYLTTNPAGTEYATNWTVYGSNDGNTFTAIQTFAVNSVGYFNLTNNIAYSYYRIGSNTLNAAWFSINNLKLYTNINANNTFIQNLSDPVLAQDAATKNYVDLYVSALSVFNVGTHGILLTTNAITLTTTATALTLTNSGTIFNNPKSNIITSEQYYAGIHYCSCNCEFHVFSCDDCRRYYWHYGTRSIRCYSCKSSVYNRTDSSNQHYY